MENNTVKSIEEIKAAYINKEYQTKLPSVSDIPYTVVRTETIVWNEEKKQEHKDAIKNAKKARQEDSRRLHKKMENDIIDSIMDSHSLTREQTETLYAHVSEKCSYTYEIFDAIFEFADVVERIIEMTKHK